MDEMLGKNCATCVRHNAKFPNEKCSKCIENSNKDNKFPEWEAES